MQNETNETVYSEKLWAATHNQVARVDPKMLE
jgi:hypothetical protein